MAALLAVAWAAPAQVTVVSGASFDDDSILAPGSIASAFGQNLAPGVEVNTVTPLPTTLLGVRVTVTDAALRTVDCPLFFVSPGQINFLLPDDLANGPAFVRVRPPGDAPVQEGTVTIARVSPGLFMQPAEENWAAALLLRVKPDGTQTRESIYHAPEGAIVPRTLELSPGGDEKDQLYLEIYGTGFRNAGGADNVLTVIGNVASGGTLTQADLVPTLYAGEQGGFAGLDQLTVGPLNRRLEFFGGCPACPIIVLAGERQSNTVWMQVARNPNAPVISNPDFSLVAGSPPRVRYSFDYQDADADLGPYRMVITWVDAQQFCTKAHDTPGSAPGASGRASFEIAKPSGTQLGPIIGAVMSLSDARGHISNLVEWQANPAGSMSGFPETCDVLSRR